jgi:hypothetical protein
MNIEINVVLQVLPTRSVKAISKCDVVLGW